MDKSNNRGVRNSGIGRRVSDAAARIPNLMRLQSLWLDQVEEWAEDIEEGRLCVTCAHPVHTKFVKCWLCDCRGPSPTNGGGASLDQVASAVGDRHGGGFRCIRCGRWFAYRDDLSAHLLAGEHSF